VCETAHLVVANRWYGESVGRRPTTTLELDTLCEMEPTEIQARATIAAALIVSHAVDVPSIPTSGDWSKDTVALRLRDLTDYLYQMITTSKRP
jgi:hypothetical protein